MTVRLAAAADACTVNPNLYSIYVAIIFALVYAAAALVGVVRYHGHKSGVHDRAPKHVWG